MIPIDEEQECEMQSHRERPILNRKEKKLLRNLSKFLVSFAEGWEAFVIEQCGSFDLSVEISTVDWGIEERQRHNNQLHSTLQLLNQVGAQENRRLLESCSEFEDDYRHLKLLVDFLPRCT